MVELSNRGPRETTVAENTVVLATTMVRFLEKLTDLLTRILAALALCLALALMLVTVANVLLRYFGNPIIGTVELVSYGMLALIVTALPYAAKHNSHISVSILTDRLRRNETKRRVYGFGYMLSAVATLAVACAYLIGSLEKSSSSVASGLVDIPVIPFNLLVVAGFATWALQCTLSFLRCVKSGADTGDDS